MSEMTYDVDEKLWEQYLQECRAANEAGMESHPSLSDYSVWLSDNDMDEDESL